MSEVLLHNVLIGIHTVGAAVCFFSALTVLSPPVGKRANRGWRFKVFLGGFPIFLAPLFLAIAFDWPRLDSSLMVIFPALGVLDLFMTWRAFRAFRLFQSKPAGWQLKYMGHVGFNLISFFAGFVIVLAIDLGAPIWLVAVIAVASIVGGIYSVNRVRAKEKKAQHLV